MLTLHGHFRCGEGSARRSIAELAGGIGEAHLAEHIRALVAVNMAHLAVHGSAATVRNAGHWQGWALGLADGVVGIGMDSVLKRVPQGGEYDKHRDFWPVAQYPDKCSGYVPPEADPAVAQALPGRGYGEAAVRAILGENFLRVAGQVCK